MKLLLSKRAITRSSDSSVDKTKTVIAIKIGNINGVNIVDRIKDFFLTL
jgi:hypothetical protein